MIQQAALDALLGSVLCLLSHCLEIPVVTVCVCVCGEGPHVVIHIKATHTARSYWETVKIVYKTYEPVVMHRKLANVTEHDIQIAHEEADSLNLVLTAC